MMSQWKPDMIRFMRDASEFGGYYREIAGVMLPHLSRGSHVCDAGCGLGYLAIELSKSVGKVTAVDINQNALSVLNGNRSRMGIKNIDVICGDAYSVIPSEKYDAMAFCYFGEIDAILTHADSLCSGPIFIFTRNYEMHRFSAGNFKIDTCGYENMCKRLEQLGISYEALEMENEFGQPFRNMEDARRFFELYSRDGNSRTITDLLLLDRITYTDREDFPLYMPYLKKTGCIIINLSENKSKVEKE